MHFSYSEAQLQTSPRLVLCSPCTRAWATWTCFLRAISLVSGSWGKAGREGALKAFHFSVLEWSTTYPGPQPNALDHSTPRSYSRVFIIPLLKPRKTASRKQITVGKQEYLSLTTMALSNQRGRADEPLITCAIMTSVSSIPWQAGSGWSSQGPVMLSSPQAWNWYEGPSPSWSQVSRHTPHRGCL